MDKTGEKKQLENYSEGKLCIYSNFKILFGIENYLTIITSFEQRRHFTRLRISSHKLQIERGRYQGVPRQNRLCLRCASSEIDDEIQKHLFFHVQLLLRKELK